MAENNTTDSTICCIFLIIVIVICFVVVYVIIPSIIIASIIGIIIGAVIGIICYCGSFVNNIFKSPTSRPVAKVVGIIVIVGVIISASSACYLGYEYFNGNHQTQKINDFSNIPTNIMDVFQNTITNNNNNEISKTSTISTDNLKVEDITNPSKNMMPKECTTGTLLYSNLINFGSEVNTYSLKLHDINPITTIKLNYIAEEISYDKTYTEKSTGITKQAHLTVPDPDAGFEIIIYDSNGNLVSKTGYGSGIKGIDSKRTGYSNYNDYEIKIYDMGEFNVEMIGIKISVDIQIMEDK